MELAGAQIKAPPTLPVAQMVAQMVAQLMPLIVTFHLVVYSF